MDDAPRETWSHTMLNDIELGHLTKLEQDLRG